MVVDHTRNFAAPQYLLVIQREIASSLDISSVGQAAETKWFFSELLVPN
jgi:hypothetical protein